MTAYLNDAILRSVSSAARRQRSYVDGRSLVL
jgi:hypothetical protein